MTTTDLIELHLGTGRWVRVCQGLVSLLGLVAIVSSPVPLGWVGAALGALFLVHVLTARKMGKAAGSGRLVLRGDNSATLFAGGKSACARYRGRGWASRWLCVLPLETLESGRPLNCVVCRSQNSQDSYRRLLVRLRSDGAPDRDRDLGWTW